MFLGCPLHQVSHSINFTEYVFVFVLNILFHHSIFTKFNLTYKLWWFLWRKFRPSYPLWTWWVGFWNYTYLLLIRTLGKNRLLEKWIILGFNIFKSYITPLSIKYTCTSICIYSSVRIVNARFFRSHFSLINQLSSFFDIVIF